MPWGRIDDSLYDHPKLDDFPSDEETLRRIVESIPLEDLVRLAGIGLWARAISYSNRHLTDGSISRSIVTRKLDASVELADAVMHAGLFDVSHAGYLVHDFLDFNDSRADVLERRDKEAKRKAAYRAEKLSQRDNARDTKKGRKPRPGGSPSGTTNGKGSNVPPSVPAGHDATGEKMSRAESRRVSHPSRARTRGIRESRPDPTRTHSESVPTTSNPSRANGAEPLLSAKELEAWSPYRRKQWDGFKAAWLGRGFKLPPAGDPDDERSQAHVVWEILDNRPTDLVLWVTEAPGRTSHQVVGHLLERWQAIKAEAGADDVGAPDWLPSKAEAAETVGSIMARLAEKT